MQNNIKKAAKLIDEGKLVIFPTETVYGIGADAFNIDACSLIFKLKNRPQNNPLILHCLNLDIAKSIATFNDIALCLASFFWPGPVSLVLPKKIQQTLSNESDNNAFNSKQIANIISAGLDTVCIRIPDNEIALTLLQNTKNKIIAAPSANISNYVSPTEIDHVRDVFKGIQLLDGGRCIYGIESTIIDCVNPSEITILRTGFICADAINEVLRSHCKKHNLAFNKVTLRTLKPSVISAPGMMLKHYSTHTNLQINQDNNANLENRVHINFGNSNFLGKKVYNLSELSSLKEAAANLYAILRQADEFAKANGIQLITISSIPNENIGIAINEKLQKAQHI